MTLTIDLQLIAVNTITPSPYQQRKYFDPSKLSELAKSISRDGLIEPIVVRPLFPTGYELIAGERRLRACQLSNEETILSRVVVVSDKQARRMCAAENMQRDDLSPIEAIHGIVELIDAEMVDEVGYQIFGSTALERVKFLLMKLDSDYRNDTDLFTHKFMCKVESIFSNLPKAIEWRSFYNNDLPLITTLDEEVTQVAIEQKLNKSQAKELGKLKEEAPQAFERLVKQGGARPEQVGDFSFVFSEEKRETPELVKLSDLSAREIKDLRRPTLELSRPGVPTALQMSESNEWYTPEKYVEAARKLMGGIDLDPASNDYANSKVIKAAKYYTLGTDGFNKEWLGRVWLNPPYGRDNGESNQELWSARLIEQYETGNTDEAILLVNAVTDRTWFQPLWNYPICFTNHRIRFYSPDIEAGQPTHGNVLVYFGTQHKRFAETFKQFGPVVMEVVI
jgi:hypothetical protein